MEALDKKIQRLEHSLILETDEYKVERIHKDLNMVKYFFKFRKNQITTKK